MSIVGQSKKCLVLSEFCNFTPNFIAFAHKIELHKGKFIKMMTKHY